jgi:hypothetical protein
MGHSFEFFTLALCFWSTCEIITHIRHGKKATLSALFYCALAIVLTLQMRPANINVILLPLILFGFIWVRESLKKLPMKQLMQSLLYLLLGMVVCFLPFIYINLHLYDMVYPSSDAMYGNSVNPVPAMHGFTDLLQAIWFLLKRTPQLGTIAFSSEFGLAFCSSILFFGVIFSLWFVAARIKTKPWLCLTTLVLMLGYLGLPIAITLFWQSLGDAYGYRFLFCYFPLAILGYAYWYHQLQQKYGAFKHYPVKAKLLQVTILSLCGFSLWANMVFGLNDTLLYQPGVPNSFGREGGGAVGYNFAVLQATKQPSTWLNLVATRTPGFFAVGMMDALAIHPENIQSKLLAEKIEKFKRQYEYPPLRVYVQVLLLCGFFIAGLIGFCRKDFEKPAA